jgi:hypothetical protein
VRCRAQKQRIEDIDVLLLATQKFLAFREQNANKQRTLVKILTKPVARSNDESQIQTF